MSTTIKCICDRCGKEIGRRKYPIIHIMQTRERLKITRIFSSDPYNYDEQSYDLCVDCMRDVDEFLGIR